MVFGHHQNRHGHQTFYPSWTHIYPEPRTTIIRTDPPAPAPQPTSTMLQMNTFVAVGAIVAAVALGAGLVYMTKK